MSRNTTKTFGTPVPPDDLRAHRADVPSISRYASDIVASQRVMSSERPDRKLHIFPLCSNRSQAIL